LIGTDSYDGLTLNALVDDLALYDFAMSSDQIALLEADVDPLEEGAVLPETTTPSLPQEPTTQITTSTLTEANNNLFYGFPLWAIIMIGSILVVFIGLTVLFQFYEPVPPKKKQKTTNGETEDSSKGGGQN
jgi:tetrahydromethanopterin S-methyltransferase subunit B